MSKMQRIPGVVLRRDGRDNHRQENIARLLLTAGTRTMSQMAEKMDAEYEAIRGAVRRLRNEGLVGVAGFDEDTGHAKFQLTSRGSQWVLDLMERDEGGGEP